MVDFARCALLDSKKFSKFSNFSKLNFKIHRRTIGQIHIPPSHQTCGQTKIGNYSRFSIIAYKLLGYNDMRVVGKSSLKDREVGNLLVWKFFPSSSFSIEDRC